MSIRTATFTIIASFLLSGCLSDKAAEKRSAEVLTYQEQHFFQLSPHAEGKLFDSQRLADVLRQFDPLTAHFELYFSSKLTPNADQITAFLLENGTSPYQITLNNGSKSTAVELTVTQWQRKVEKCESPKHGQVQTVKGCRVESNRMSQLVFIDSYMGED
jgi:hypothetical protein